MSFVRATPLFDLIRHAAGKRVFTQLDLFSLWFFIFMPFLGSDQLRLVRKLDLHTGNPDGPFIVRFR